MLPKVIIFNALSADGRLDWFAADQGLFYSLAASCQEDATLAGSTTICQATSDMPAEQAEDLVPAQLNPDDTRPLLVVVDSRGQVRNWDALRKAGYWREVIALCSQTTPATYLNYLKERAVKTIITGEQKVDLRHALEMLNELYSIKIVRVESGGTLNGVLLRANLVDEINLLLHPCLVGGTSSRSFYRAPDLTSPQGVIPLKLKAIEQLEGDKLWVQYEVVKG